MNDPIQKQTRARANLGRAIAGMLTVLGVLVAAIGASAQTTNAYDAATNSVYDGDGPGNGLGGVTGLNGGYGFGPWTFTVNSGNGGAFIEPNGPSGDSFDLWNTSGSGLTSAVRPFGAPLVPGQSFSVQLRYNSLDNSTTTNLLELQDANGNILFSYWHVGNEPNNAVNGSYSDTFTNRGAAVGFSYNYQKFNSFTFTLNSSTNYTFTDNTSGHAFSGAVSGVVAQVAFLRANGTAGTSGGGDDYQFDVLQIVSSVPAAFSSETPAPGSYSVSPAASIITQIVDGSAPVNTNSVVFHLDGSAVAPTVTKSGGLTTISYTPASPLSPGTLHTALVTLTDNDSVSYTNEWSFTTGFPSLPATLPGPIVVSNNEIGLVIFSSSGDAWLGTNYGESSSRTLYARFSINFDNLNGETGGGGGYGGMHFYVGGVNGTTHLLVGNAWVSQNWSMDPYPQGSQTDLNPVTPIVFDTWHTIVERIDYTPGADSTVTIWLDPNFTLTEAAQTNTPTTISMDDTVDTVLLRTGNGTTSATFSNIIMAATSADAGFAAPASPQFLNLTPGANAPSAPVSSPIGAQVVFGTYSISTNAVQMSLDGNSIAPAFVVATNSLTLNYQPSTPFAAGSSHNVALAVTDADNNSYETNWSFTVDAYPSLPVTIPGPIDVVYGIYGDLGIQIFNSQNEWIGANYQSSSTNTLYAQFSMVFFDLNGKTGVGGAYGGLHFYEGTTERLLTGDDWISTNWSADAKEAGEFDLPPVVPIVLDEWHTMVVKSVYSPGNDTAINVWLDPDFTKAEANQPNPPLTVSMDNTFDNVRLRCGQGTAAAEYTNIVMSAVSPFAPPPPVLSIQGSSGTATLSWVGAGTLQAAPTVAGPWKDSSSQANPQTVATTNSAMFFRLRP